MTMSFNLVIAFFLCLVAHSIAQYTCSTECNPGQCCWFGCHDWCPTDVAIGVGAAQEANSANATVQFFKAEQFRWDLKAVNAYCSTWNANKPLYWRRKYGWAAFCSPFGSNDHEACGKCLKVKNTATGAYEIVRIVDKCSNTGDLSLDSAVFQKLDNNGKGKLQGHLIVKYEFVDCKD